MSEGTGAGPLTVWCVVRSPDALRFLAPVIAALERRGHRVEVDVGIPERGVDLGAERLELERRRQAVERPGPDPLGLPGGPRGRSRLLEVLWRLGSYAAQARYWPPILRRRGRLWLPRPLRAAARTAESMRARWLFENRILARATRAIERAVPPRREVVRRLDEVAPDVVLVSPIVYPEAPEIEALKAARRAGVPSIGAVLSWDNLSTKGSFQIEPDRLVVWNERQREEASTFHGFPPGSVEVTGAPVFDYLFDAPEATPRAEVLAEAGLPPESRYALYAVSTKVLGLGGEVEVVRSLAAALRREWADGEPPWILVRPHPANREGWRGVDFEGARVWPRIRAPETAEARRDLFASLDHAEALIGLNTSMFLEAAIVDRTCISLARAESIPELRHFGYLEEGGFLHVPATIGDAVRTLREAIESGDPRAAERQRFVGRFLRPAGLDRPAADVTADRIAALARELSGDALPGSPRPVPAPPRRGSRAARPR